MDRTNEDLAYWKDMAQHLQKSIAKILTDIRKLSWTPCSVKNPEKDGRYLVAIDKRVVDFCWYRNGEWIQIIDQKAYRRNVNAWRFPDKPYGGY